ncbi:TPA: hypothetical protein N0F65_006251 [Lagenidium giganteum]|uniref:Uncharacterized protein n=1 Tax=Lagenidium giganteum TaxID=4803 RepID=A0AAV2Z5B0_9STRA|nr:TPA: hypothetical protein N0F65_006251 [Lagenidium giganteum]
MAVATDHSNWVRELDTFEAERDEDDDARYEVSSVGARGVSSARSAHMVKTKPGQGTARRSQSISQAEELKQEMKLLNWHKLANEAALKAAIIKTSKLKQEDTHLATALAQETSEERQQRIQQIIEEEQLKPLQVNSEFFREFATKEQSDEVKMENEVQRHIRHLQKLKQSFAEREEMHRRRHRYKEGMQELNAMSSRSSMPSQSITKPRNSNQDEEQHQQQMKAKKRLFQQQRGMTEQAMSTAEVICSLDKLMELEKRIRNLEEAGLGVDIMEGSVGGSEMGDTDVLESNQDSGIKSTKSIKFSKRKSLGGLNEPSKTVYAVLVNKNANKMRSKQEPRKGVVGSTGSRSSATNSTTKQRGTGAPGRNPQTFLTSVPEKSKTALRQQNLRRMNDRERRQFLKNEKAQATRETAAKQNVVINGWMEKKKQAENARKVTNKQATQRPPQTGSTRRAQHLAPAKPSVKAPTLGAASGKRVAVSNTHMQKFQDMKSGFDKRREVMNKAPTTVKQPTLNNGAKKFGSSLPPTSSGSAPRAAAKRPAGAPERPPVKLPAISSKSSTSQNHPRFGIIGNKKDTSVNSAASFGLGGSFSTGQPNKSLPVASSMSKSTQPFQSMTLPRITGQVAPVPSPPPQKAKNASMPHFSRLHKR